MCPEKPQRKFQDSFNGALLIDKHSGVSSFGIIEILQNHLLSQNPLLRKKDLPKLGHGGTLDPFATGVLVVLVGRSVKLARYFLGATKYYEGVIRFGETTVPGDPTSPVSETCAQIPESLEQLREVASRLTRQPYLQTPPMHSAKKIDGKPLYELARAGKEVEREPKLCHLYEFEILSYENGRAHFRLVCSSGTYVRVLAQDLGRLLGTVAMLDSLNRTGSGIFHIKTAMTTHQIAEAMAQGQSWNQLPCWVPFDQLLGGYSRADANQDEAEALIQGRQNVLFNILARNRSQEQKHPPGQSDYVAIYCADSLVAVAHRDKGVWGLERVFTRD